MAHTQAQPSPATSALDRARPLLARALWRSGAPLLLLAWLVAWLAYQAPLSTRISLSTVPSPLILSGVHRPELSEANGWYRWTTGKAKIVVPGAGPRETVLRLSLYGAGPAEPGRPLRLSSGGLFLAEVPLRPNRQEIVLIVPRAAFDQGDGALSLELEVPTIVAPGDPRPLGVVLQQIALEPAAGAPGLPAERALELGFAALLVFWCLRLAGVPAGWSAACAVAALATIGGALWQASGPLTVARLQAARGLDLLVAVLPLTLLLALLLRLLTRRWEADGPAPWAAALRCAVLLIFALRLAGVLHPQFINIDQGLRANQLAAVAEGRAHLIRPALEQQYEWGTREPVPYSLLTYYMLAPLAWAAGGVHRLADAVKLVTVLIDASVPLLLWLLLRDGLATRREGELAAAGAGLTYAALPVGYLFFHDGSFPTTIGVWLVLVALAAIRLALTWAGHRVAEDGLGRADRVRPPWSPGAALRVGICAIALALAIAAYVTHIAFVPFLVGALAGSMWLLGGAGLRRDGARIVALLAAGFLMAWLAVYRDYTVTLVQRTIPAYLGIIADAGSVGRDSDQLYGTPVNTVPEHLVAHFRVWPVLLGGAALAGLLAARRRCWAAHLGLAYAAFFVATLAAERWFGLWNKHMYFAAPGVALLAGVGLAWLWRRGWPGRLVCALLLGLLFWSSSVAWADRALWYNLPPQAL